MAVEDVYSSTQMSAIRWLSGSSALLSFCSSLALVIHISYHQKRKTYHRFLLGISLVDMASSSTLFVSRFLELNDPSRACSNVGLILVVAICASAFYNASLAVLFLLMVKYGTKERLIEKFFEIPCHVTAIVAPAIVALLAYFLESINPVSFAAECWLGPFPSGCLGDECTRGQDWGFILEQITHVVFYLVVVVLAVCNIMIYCKVRTTLGRNRRYSAARPSRGLSFDSTENSRDFSLEESTARPATKRRVSLGTLATRRRSSVSNGTASESTERRSRQVAIRSFLFFCGFAVSYTCTTLIADIERWAKTSPHGTWWFYLFMVLDGLLFPLQGFWDSIIYFRPRYVQWRSTRNNYSRLYSLQKTIFSMEKPSSGNTRSSRYRSSFTKVERSKVLRSDEEEDLSFAQEMQRCNALALSIRVHAQTNGVIG